MRRRKRAGEGGQSLLELALVLPVLLLLVGGAVQYAVIMAAKHSLIEISRDTARWVSTQRADPCILAATPIPPIPPTPPTPPQPVTEADRLATTAGLIGYTPGMWHPDPGGNFVYGTSALPADAPHPEGVEVAWTGGLCPPIDNTTTAFVTVRLTHEVPIFLPVSLIPGLCPSGGCQLSVSASAMFRMEPPPE